MLYRVGYNSEVLYACTLPAASGVRGGVVRGAVDLESRAAQLVDSSYPEPDPTAADGRRSQRRDGLHDGERLPLRDAADVGQRPLPFRVRDHRSVREGGPVSV